MHESTPIALVTGAGRRLGRQIAYALADAGYDIILHHHTAEAGADEAGRRITASGRKVWSLQADLSSTDQVRGLTDRVAGITPRLDVLVNNAGVFPEAAVEDVTEEIWDLALDVNTRGMFFVTQGCIPMLKAAGGCVVNLASTGGFEPWKRHLPYNVSKAGVIMLTRALAKTLAPDIRVNAIAPGVIVIPGEEVREHIPETRFPLSRYGTADDLARAVLFLARDARYTTGHVLPVDGGSIAAG